MSSSWLVVCLVSWLAQSLVGSLNWLIDFVANYRLELMNCKIMVFDLGIASLSTYLTHSWLH